MRGTVRQVSHRAAVGEQILEKLICNAIPPGERISEDELASEFGVSRTPVREALIVLERQKLVVNEANRGFFAASVSFEGLRSYFDMAGWVFPFLFQRAASQLGDTLPGAVIELKMSEPSADTTTPLLLHYRFIASIALAAHNAYAADIVIAGESFHCMMRSSILKSCSESARLAANLELHKCDLALIAALRSGSKEDIATAIEASLTTSRAFLASGLI